MQLKVDPVKLDQIIAQIPDESEDEPEQDFSPEETGQDPNIFDELL